MSGPLLPWSLRTLKSMVRPALNTSIFICCFNGKNEEHTCIPMQNQESLVMMVDEDFPFSFNYTQHEATSDKSLFIYRNYLRG